MTATRLRLLKSKPLVTICVPIRISILPSLNSLIVFFSKFLFWAVSLSSLAIRA